MDDEKDHHKMMTGMEMEMDNDAAQPKLVLEGLVLQDHWFWFNQFLKWSSAWFLFLSRLTRTVTVENWSRLVLDRC